MSNLFDSGIRPIVDNYLLKQAAERRDYGDYWSASSAGYCMRKNIFERLQVPYVTEDARKQRVFSSGHIFHAWLQDITKQAGLSIAQELELQDEELMIRGHIDDLVLVGGAKPGEVLPFKGKVGGDDYNEVVKSAQPHLILYDYKTAHSRSFTYSKGRPMSHYHKYQLATYMLMLRQLMGEPVKPAELDDLPELVEARILTISKDDLRMDEKQLMWSEELSSEVRDYWTELNKWWKEKKLPPCTCADHEGGFMAKEQYNPYWYEGEPCSIAWFTEWKESNKVKENSNGRE